MSQKLQEIKDQYAREKGYKDWADLIEFRSPFDEWEESHDEIAIRYATACCKATQSGIVAEIEKVANQYPYKKSGDRESYSVRRDAMSDAFGRAEQAAANSSIVIL